MNDEYNLIIGEHNMGVVSGAEAAGEAFIAAINLAHTLNNTIITNVMLINNETGEIVGCYNPQG